MRDPILVIDENGVLYYHKIIYLKPSVPNIIGIIKIWVWMRRFCTLTKGIFRTSRRKARIIYRTICHDCHSHWFHTFWMNYISGLQSSVPFWAMLHTSNCLQWNSGWCWIWYVNIANISFVKMYLKLLIVHEMPVVVHSILHITGKPVIVQVTYMRFCVYILLIKKKYFPIETWTWQCFQLIYVNRVWVRHIHMHPYIRHI